MSQQRRARSTAIALCALAIGVGCGGMESIDDQTIAPTGGAGSSGTGVDTTSGPGGGNDAAAGRGGDSQGGGGGPGGTGGNGGAPAGAGGNTGGAGSPGGAGGNAGGSSGVAGIGGRGGGGPGGRGGAVGTTSGGGAVDAGSKSDAASAPTFTEIYTNILLPYCSGSSCHDPGTAKNIGFASRSSAYTAVRARVKPGNGAGSSFFRTVNSGSMPRGAPKLSPENLAKIQAWIDAGALDN
jgi:hypothetical protein